VVYKTNFGQLPCKVRNDMTAFLNTWEALGEYGKVSNRETDPL